MQRPFVFAPCRNRPPGLSKRGWSHGKENTHKQQEKPSDTRCRGLRALSCSDFVEVNRIVWLKCCARRMLHVQRVWDAAQQVLARQGALYIQRHCLQRLWWYHGALLAVANFSPLFHRYDVGPLLRVTVIVATLFQPGVMFGFYLFDGGALLGGKLGSPF